MAQKQNFTFEIELFLLEKIDSRVKISGSNRNYEMRGLLEIALNTLGEEDGLIIVPETKKKAIVANLDFAVISEIGDRARRFHRSRGREIVRLLSYALEESAKREIAVLMNLLRQLDQPSPSL